MQKEIVNKVAQSGIVTIDLEQLIPDIEVVSIDIKDQLFQEFVLKEKDFRAWIKDFNWDVYKDKAVALYCSNDAIVPTWAYMLLTTALAPHTNKVYFTEPNSLPEHLANTFLSEIDPKDYTDKRVVIKGCGDREVSNHAFVKLSALLVPEVKSLMFGEPCSTVPVYKKR